MTRDGIAGWSKLDLTIGALVVGILALDIWSPLGLAVGLLYVIPVWLTVWSNVPAAPLKLSLLCVTLTLLDALISPPSSAPLWYGLTNRLMISLVIILGGYLAQREITGRATLAQEIAKREATETALRESELRQRLVEAVKESEARLNLALEAAQMGAWELDLRHDTAFRSIQHDAIFGYDALQPEWGKAIFLTHVVPEDREGVQQKFEEARATGRLNFECRILWQDQSLHWIAARGRVHHDEQGHPSKLLGTVMDITERKRLEQERESLIAQLQDSLSRVKSLEGILPICAHCKRIRDEQGQWQAVETYVRGRSNADFSHGICPICLDKYYPGV